MGVAILCGGNRGLSVRGAVFLCFSACTSDDWRTETATSELNEAIFQCVVCVCVCACVWYAERAVTFERRENRVKSRKIRPIQAFAPSISNECA